MVYLETADHEAQKQEAADPIEDKEYQVSSRISRFAADKGRGTKTAISVPREIDDFEVLKRELTSYHPFTVFKANVYPFSFLAVILMIGAWFLLLTSRARPVVLVAGIAALGLQAVGAYSLVVGLRGKKDLRFIALMLVFTWLLIAGIVSGE